MKMYKICLLFIVSALASQANDSLDYRYRSEYGLFLNLQNGWQKPNFRSLQDIYTCNIDNFTEGDAFGFGAGLLYETHLYKSLHLAGRLSVTSLTGQLIQPENKLVSNDGEKFMAQIDYIFETEHIDYSVDIMLALRVLSDGLIYLGSSMVYMHDEQVKYYEKLKKPSDWGHFENDKRTRNEYPLQTVGEQSSNFFMLKMGAAWEFPLDAKHSWRLAPEMFYNIGLSGLHDKYQWDLNTLTIGAAIKYAPLPDYQFEARLLADIDKYKEIRKTIFKSCDTLYTTIEPDYFYLKPYAVSAAGIRDWQLVVKYGDTPVLTMEGDKELPDSIKFEPDKSRLMAPSTEDYTYEFTVNDINDRQKKASGSINVRQKKNYFYIGCKFDRDGKDTLLTIDKKITTNVQPLLNYVFFEKESSRLPKRYIEIDDKQSSTFTLDDLYGLNTLETYQQLLNIIGFRMKQSPKSAIELIGCVDGLGPEEENYGLARARAQRIKKYLTKSWGIAASRIKIKVNSRLKALPRQASTTGKKSDRALAAEENRRVEIEPLEGFDYLIAPVVTRDTAIVQTSKNIHATVKANSDNGVSSWQLKLSKPYTVELYEKNGSTEDENIEIDLGDKLRAISTDGAPINYIFTGADTLGLRCEHSGSLPISIKVIETSEFKYSLILFDFDSYSITGKNLQITEMIDSSIEPNARVTITGLTDMVGDSLVNLALSKRRALGTSLQLIGRQLDATETINDNTTSDVAGGVEAKSSSGKDYILDIRGIGEARPLKHDNSLPEGRFYCRTVTVHINNRYK